MTSLQESGAEKKQAMTSLQESGTEKTSIDIIAGKWI